ncbi:magnesium-translocating P-type ATPase [Solimonas soli]|uniref:magnesium-translocating P-type ATPase n=1 Tax=Solimonas soli TaxID=413479 RepID=UPI0004B7F71F|nr:magnesium-translocating P-type ATPase [Solimonas soli]
MPAAWWSLPAARLFTLLDSTPEGLGGEAATRRRADPSRQARHAPGYAGALVAQFRSPLQLILVLGAASALLGRDWLNAAIVLAIVVLSSALSAADELRASRAVERLRARVAARATVLRDGVAREMAADAVVAGDVVLLSAGSLVPGDGIVLEARDFFVSQALLTGETFPVEKRPGPCAATATLAQRLNCVFRGTSVRSGTARVLIVASGEHTAIGEIAQRLTLRPPETSFERGLRQLGRLLLQIMVVVLVAVIAANLLMHRHGTETLLFAVALAVGISPELLPAIVAITLSRGAQRMARRGVIVRHPNAIENLGAMDVLCVDKTGTLTRGVIELDGALDTQGRADPEVLRLAHLNAALQTGLRNPIDEALVNSARQAGQTVDAQLKLDEIPYDFVRKRLGVVVRDGAQALLVVKGAVAEVLEVCTQYAAAGGDGVALDAAARAALDARFTDWSAQGYRVLALARRALPLREHYGHDDEAALTLCGFLLFFDPPDPAVVATLARLRALGVRTKIISGDNRHVAAHVAREVGIGGDALVTGAELAAMTDEALWQRAPATTLFAEVDPNQKERIIRALQKRGHTVGFLGDGINDAPALYAADAGISVDSATDVAKEAADFVMLEHGLDAVCEGIEEGRHTFANTLKYVFVTTSANFGNMVSMALASLYLPFLPLLAKQILLNNLLSDIPSMSIARDRVDRAWEDTPHRWNIALVRRVMVVLGLVSTAFDMLTFAVLLHFSETPERFRSAWFVESLLTELLVIFVVRSYRPFWRGRPSRAVLGSALAVAAIALLLPYAVPGRWFGLVPLPWPLLATVLAISVLYALVSELVKRPLYAHHGLGAPGAAAMPALADARHAVQS